MTVRIAENVIQLTNTPIRCSACFNQDPKLRHIDMDAACDRGYGDEAAVKIAYDDLVLCENCVKEAAVLVGLEPADHRELAQARRELANERELRRRAERWAKTMQDAIANMPSPPEIDHRKRPRPLRTSEEVVA